MKLQSSLVTIGISVRNESQTILPFIQSLLLAATKAAGKFELETIVCVNGSTDNSHEVLTNISNSKKFSCLNLSVTRSRPGKIEAQKSIAQTRKLDGYMCFLDADILVQDSILVELHNALSKNMDLKIAYASPRYLSSQSSNFVEWVHDLPNRDHDILTPRKYFHGRAFMLRSATILLEALSLKRSKLIGRKYRLVREYLELERGPLIDDVFLSRFVVHKYGVKSIAEVSQTRVYAVPPHTLLDWYQGWRRVFIEIRRLNLMYPEHRYIQNMHFLRRVRISRGNKNVSTTLKRFVFLFSEITVKFVAKGHILLNCVGFGPKQLLWEELRSTKNFGRLSVNEVCVQDFSKLNIGCGPDPTKCLPKPWLNIDAAGEGADFLCDVRILPDEWSGQFGEVRASHVLEHFFLRELPQVLMEWIRVLEPMGTLRIIVPDLAVIVRALVEGKDVKGRSSLSISETTPVLAQIYGVGYDDPLCDPRWRHRFLFDEKLLIEFLSSLGALIDIHSYAQKDDPVCDAGIWDDSQNPFSICVKATKRA